MNEIASKKSLCRASRFLSKVGLLFVLSTGTLSAAAVESTPTGISPDSFRFGAPGQTAIHSQAGRGPAHFEMPPVSGILSGRCEATGDEANGSVSCLQSFSDGSKRHLSIFSVQEENFKRQTVTREFDSEGNLVRRLSVRQKKSSRETLGKKQAFQHFDIVTRSPGEPVTRELLVIEYLPASEKVRRVTWTSYRQIAETGYAEMTHHVSLSYDADGNPQRGRAEQWQDRQLAKVLMNWAPSTEPMASSAEAWRMWENRLRGILHSAVYSCSGRLTGGSASSGIGTTTGGRSTNSSSAISPSTGSFFASSVGAGRTAEPVSVSIPESGSSSKALLSISTGKTALKLS